MAARFKDLCLGHHTLADRWCAAMGYVRRDVHEPAQDDWARPKGVMAEGNEFCVFSPR